MARIVKVPPQPQKPFIARDTAYPSNDHGSYAADWFVATFGEEIRLDRLRGHVAEEVDYERGLKLGEVGTAGLHVGVGAEGDFDGVYPGCV